MEKTVDPIRDLEIIQFELILADLQQVKKRLEKLKVRDEKSQKEKEILQFVQEKLEKETPLSQLNFSEEENKVVKSCNFLTNKPVFLLANYSGKTTEFQNLEKYAQTKKLDLFPLAVKLETEATELSPLEREAIGWTTATDFSLLTQKIKELLKLKAFFTVGEDEVKN